jgi:multidrug efflux pump subunit AcrB
MLKPMAIAVIGGLLYSLLLTLLFLPAAYTVVHRFGSAGALSRGPSPT